DDHGDIDLVPLLVHTLKLDSYVADLLGLVFASDGEFDIVALAEAAELVNFIMVAGDECTHLALGHLQVFLGGIQVGAYCSDLGVDVLNVFGAGLGSQFRMDGSVESRELLSRLIIQLSGLKARLLELALGNLQLVGDDLQITLQIGIGLLILRDAVLERRHVLLRRLLSGLDFRSDCLLRSIKLCRGIPAESQASNCDQTKYDDRG